MIHFKPGAICLFGSSCSTGMQHPKHAPHRPYKLIFPVLFFFSNQKAKGRHLTQRSLLCTCAGQSRDTFRREKDSGFESCAKFHIQLWNRMRFLQTISIITKCYPSLFAHTIFHIILTFPCLLLKNKTTYKIYMCFHATVLSAFRM